MTKFTIDTKAEFPKQNTKKYPENIYEILNYYKSVIDNSVTGWFGPLDIVITYGLIRDCQNIKGDICELGVAYGKSAICLSLAKKQEENLYLYDNFNAEITPEHAKSLIDNYGKDENIIWRVQDLTEVTLENLEMSPLRYLHIDACHMHSTVLRDLNNFSKFLMSDGVISVDDFNDPEYPGINTAITEFCLSEDGSNWTIFAIGGNKAYLCNKKMVKYYQNFIYDYLLKINYISFTVSEFMDNYIILAQSREPMDKDRVLDIINGKEKLIYG